MHLTLILLKERFAICRLDPQLNVPNWALVSQELVSITRSADELSIVCAEKDIPPTLISEKDWRALKIEGPLDFALSGVLYSLTKPLAEAKISIFVISTFDTDYILVREDDLIVSLKSLSKLCDFKE